MNFTVQGNPCAKGRPRFARRGNYVSAYTDEKTVNYENLVKYSFIESQGEEMFGALEVHINAYFPIPKSLSEKKKKLLLYHTKKPDCDNIAKIILDGLNGLAFHDDNQVCSLHVIKQYSEYPRVEINICEVDG